MEGEILSNSIMNFMDMYCITDKTNNKFLQFLINTEDILLKILSFLENWQINNCDQSVVIFLLKILG